MKIALVCLLFILCCSDFVLAGRYSKRKNCGCKFKPGYSRSRCISECNGGNQFRRGKVRWCTKYTYCTSNYIRLQRRRCNRRCKNAGSFGSLDCNCTPRWKGKCCKKEVTCENPGPIANGKVLGSQYKYPVGSTVTYVCTTNFKLTQGDRKYICSRHGYWTGQKPRCVPIPCQSNPCQNNGTCTNVEEGYNCDCQQGWSGANCENAIPCQSNPCLNNGTCTNLEEEYNCDCPQGWSGANCENAIPCQSNPCQNNGTCTNVEEGYNCDCPQGWSGANCENAIPCQSNPCQNNGTCTNVDEGYNCDCPQGWSGANCENAIPCQSNPCQNNGTCTNVEEGYNCDCPQGWSGANCENAIPCQSNPCQNNGTCTNVEEGYNCDCPQGWSGANCENALPCQSNPCQNNGICTNLEEGYNCICIQGWSGTNCEIAIPCQSYPCQNNGICTQVGEGYNCDCQQGWRGANCEKGSSKVRLVDKVNEYSGRLEVYYNSEWVNVCDDSFTNHAATVVCKILGFSGEGSSYAHGGGERSIMLDEVRCIGTEYDIMDCSHAGWGNHDCYHSEDVGVRCAIPCQNNTCQNNGTCTNGEKGFNCVCQQDWKGPICQVPECSTKADIIFILDASGSVGPGNFQTMKKFVKNMVGAFDIGTNEVRIGVMTFADQVKIEFNLNTYSSKNGINNAIDAISYTTGYTYTNKALLALRQLMFTTAAGDRTDVPNIGIVITDGISTSESETKIEAQRVHDAKIQMFAIGLKLAAVDELNLIASKPENVEYTKQFIDLDKIFTQFQLKTCGAIPCLSNPCQNNGTCTNVREGYNCDCPQGWSGANCENEVDHQPGR